MEIKNIIEKVALDHYQGKEISLCADLEFRKKLAQYMLDNRKELDEVFQSIGYHYTTCTNYDPFNEILAIVKGEPYFEYIANEIDSGKWLRVRYYKHLLTETKFERKQFICGEYYDAVFDTAENTFQLVNKEMKINLIRKSPDHKYTKLVFIAE